MKLTTTAQAGRQHGLKILVHGPAGAGKTRLMATTGDLEHTLILSAEAGLLSLREHDIDVATITSIDDMREAYSFVRASIKGDTDKQYRWIGIDSLSEIAEACLAHEKENTANGLRAYGEMADIMFKLIRRFRDLRGVNVVFTAKQERVADEGRLLYAPMLPGKQLSQGIAYLFDEVFALRAHRQDDGSIRRFLQTANDGVYDAKDRSGALDMAEPPNLEHIATKIAQ